MTEVNEKKNVESYNTDSCDIRTKHKSFSILHNICDVQLLYIDRHTANDECIGISFLTILTFLSQFLVLAHKYFITEEIGTPYGNTF